MKQVQSIPNATRTLTGLAHQGYTPQTAIADVIDNSIAAGATDVYVTFSYQINDDTQVVIGDNGCGMSIEVLESAMQIGSSAGLARSSLSVYGMGMKAASMSFSRKFTVVTREKSGGASEATWDMDMQDVAPWTILIGNATDKHSKMLDDVVGPKHSGTLVIWDKADFKDVVLDHRKISGRKSASTNIEKEVQDYISMVFHRFMEGKAKGYPQIRIFYNREQLEPWNPVSLEYLSDQWKPIVDDFDYPIEIDGSMVDVPYSMTTYVLQAKGEGDPDTFDRSKFGMKTQGIFPYRQDRLLQSPDWLDMLAFHPDTNAMRVVLELDPRLDSVTRTDMKKSGLALPKPMGLPIREKLSAYKANLKRLTKAKKTLTRSKIDTSAIHSGSNIAINLSLPEIEKPITRPREDGSVDVETIFGDSITELPQIDSPLISTDSRIQSVDDLEGGVLFEPRMHGAEQVILINKSHPFYQKVYLGVWDNPLAIQGFDFLLYSLAHAELLTRTDRIKAQFKRMRQEMSYALEMFVADIDTPGDDLDEELNNLPEGEI
jgi:hypothetical protein